MLIRRVSCRDELAFTEFYRLTCPILRPFVARILKDQSAAEEILQDVYVYVWQNTQAFSASRGTPVAWLYMIARSRALDSLRRSRRCTCAVELDAPESKSRELAVGGQVPDVWSHARIRQSTVLLPAAQRRILELAFTEGYTHTEIAEVTGLPLGTVKTWIRSSLMQLRGSLTTESGNLPLAA